MQIVLALTWSFVNYMWEVGKLKKKGLGAEGKRKGVGKKQQIYHGKILL